MPEQAPPQNAAELTPNQIADQLAQQATGEPPQLQREYVIETNTGSVFRGRTQGEVMEKMQKSIEHAGPRIKELSDRLEQVTAQLEQQAPIIQQYQQSQKPANPFNPQKYFEGWAQDPMTYNMLLLDQAMQQRYGMSLDQFAQQVQEAYQFKRDTQPNLIANTFKANSTFPTANPEEFEKASHAMQEVWNEYFGPNDENITQKKLEMVHAVALTRGLYQPENPSAPPQVVQQQPQQALNPFPTLNTGATGDSAEQQQFNRQTPEAIRAFVEQQFQQLR